MTKPPASPSLDPSDARDRARPAWRVACLFGVIALAIYGNALRGPFVFDDIPSIPENESLKKIWPLSVPLSPPGEGLTVSGRPLLNFSFALNQAFDAGPTGYRLTNVLIHVCAGLFLFGLTRRTLRFTLRSHELPVASSWVATIVSGLWLLHPLQSSAVTYIVQRAESLTACFYLGTLYAFARSLDSTRPGVWRALSVFFCLLGMAVKEVMVSAPIVVALYHRVVVGQSWREIWARWKPYYFAIAATWLLLIVLVARTGGRGGSAGFSLGVGWMDYWSTQFRAITSYLARALWPQPLVLDYGVEWERGIVDVLPFALVVLSLAGATITGIVRRKPAAWLGVLFFAILAPTSLMPGGRQTMAEHRMYLPLAAVLALLAIGLLQLLGKRVVLVTVALAAALGVLTVRRNTDYRSTLSIWADTVAKRPDNRWARDNLGNAFMEIGRPAEALVHYQAALALDPTDAIHHLNTGHALTRLARPIEALEHFRKAVQLAPSYPKARISLADALFHQGDIPGAIVEFQNAIALRPQDAACAYALGSLLLQSGRFSEAATELKRTLSLDPQHAEAAANLGSALAQLGRIDEAIAALREATRLNPANPEPHNNLGAIYLHLGRYSEAETEFTETLRLNPTHAMARQNLARLQARR